MRNSFLIEEYDFENSKKFFNINNDILIIAGPCSIENYDQFYSTVKFLTENGIRFIRAFPYKLRTSPYTFQGVGDKGIDIIKEIKRKFKEVKFIGEVFSLVQLKKVHKVLDVVQIGARSMFNRDLIIEVAKLKKPLILKRSFSALINEWLLSAEFFLKAGGDIIALCERGIRTFETSIRNSFDITSIIAIRKRSLIPVIADPSHALGSRKGILELSKASIAAGYNGLMLEVHYLPEKALSDSFQQLDHNEFKNLLKKVKKFYNCIKNS